MLILEDVSYRGFTAKKSKILDYAHAQIALQHLARFHAYGFILRSKKPELFEKTIKSIKETAFFENEDCTKMYGNLCDVAIKVSENFKVRLNFEIYFYKMQIYRFYRFNHFCKLPCR